MFLWNSHVTQLTSVVRRDWQLWGTCILLCFQHADRRSHRTGYWDERRSAWLYEKQTYDRQNVRENGRVLETNCGLQKAVRGTQEAIPRRLPGPKQTVRTPAKSLATPCVTLWVPHRWLQSKCNASFQWNVCLRQTCGHIMEPWIRPRHWWENKPADNILPRGRIRHLHHGHQPDSRLPRCTCDYQFLNLEMHFFHLSMQVLYKFYTTYVFTVPRAGWLSPEYEQGWRQEWSAHLPQENRGLVKRRDQKSPRINHQELRRSKTQKNPRLRDVKVSE